MSTLTAQEIYAQHIKPLPPAVRLRVVLLTMQELADAVEATEARPHRSIMELHGLGKEIWEGIDAQKYVNQLRSEWDHRS